MVTLGPLRVTEHGGEKHPKVFGSLCPTKGASISKKNLFPRKRHECVDLATRDLGQLASAEEASRRQWVRASFHCLPSESSRRQHAPTPRPIASVARQLHLCCWKI